MIKRVPVGHVLGLLVLCYVSIMDLPAAPDEWKVPDSPVRYKLSLVGKPTHPSAGYFVHLPDGGILPDATITTVVMTMDGKVLPSYTLWQNRDTGFSLVFADPGGETKEVYVYALGGRVAQLWKPESGITPSAILCTYAGREGVNTAFALAKLGRVEPAVHARNHIGDARAPLSIGGDPSGRPSPSSFYLLSYIDAPEDGSYWFAPFVTEGKCEVSIDGSRINPLERSKGWGGTGDSIVLTKGLHRVEVFQTAGEVKTNPENGRHTALMYLTWGPPSEDLKPLKARVIASSEIVRSGACQLTAVEAKNGGPVAVGIATPDLCYWFENEDPLILYQMSAVTAGQPTDATYTWSFPRQGEVEGANVQWLFPGLQENSPSLTVKSEKGTSTCLVPFFSFSTKAANLDKDEHRATFQNTLAAMLKAFPSSPDPVADWSPAWWNNLMRTVEGGKGEEPLLERLFVNHFDVLRRKLTQEQLSALQDLMLDMVQRRDPTQTLEWIQKFHSFATTGARKNELKLREGEVLMYYLGDRKRAEKIFAEMSGPGDQSDRAKIRLGDVAFMDGDLNKATAFYADVQKRARNRRNAVPLSTQLVTTQLVQAEASPSPQPGRSSSPSPFPNSPLQPASGVNLKRGALQEVSLSENVRSLTNDGYFLEARQALLAWEAEFPLSKISGDYIMRESALFLKMGDGKRARPMLEAYCQQIDASAFLPEAGSQLVTSLRATKETPSPAVVETIKKMRDRLKYHPAAKDLDSFLSGAMQPSK